jgi:isoamylase
VTTIIESARAPIGADASHSLTQPGSSSPLGATPASEGSVFSKHATGVELLLFDRVGDAQAARVIRLDPAANRSYHYWHTSSPA